MADAGIRTLIVLRHAKAAQVPGLDDRERPLTDRGEADARRVGETLLALELRPDLVLCSPSVRTRRTAELALAALAPDAPVEFERDIYQAYASELLELVRRTGPEVRTLLLVGHNPGVHELVMDLIGHDGDPGFSPGAFAVIESTGPWHDLRGGTAVTLWSPKPHERPR
ncbi:histidine phosphatase family protein [Spongiactinospora sp. TRM90649]|uniref:SixA phosphatase family protein n=1 Tax=Spongiactinospora sp. TRM90649 TaxID=3031114 RepID=UPI0023F936C3|nr:histidine phosphatase family protein [Spongiactinospora sp. TRM90649]MDF5754877.1 histidine phosphatase family protein [Spongiactinospora sp. TRM90649]